MTSPQVQRLAKYKTCEGCGIIARCQPSGPEGEWLCFECIEALEAGRFWSTFGAVLQRGGKAALLVALALLVWWAVGA